MRPQSATAATTNVHTGKAATPGIASATNPGSKAHRQPRTMKSRSAVTRSTAHCTGGTNSVQRETTSDVAASRKARANRVLDRPTLPPSWGRGSTEALGSGVVAHRIGVRERLRHVMALLDAWSDVAWQKWLAFVP
jgi:hypothetical protein